MAMRWPDQVAAAMPGPAPQPNSVAGLAACLALLELEARALGHPLVAMLLAAAGEELRAWHDAPSLNATEDPPPG